MLPPEAPLRPGPAAIAIPRYLEETYWWAYVHPSAVRVFERQWLVNLILWGNFARLRDEALDELGATITGRTLQVACVYGNLSARLVERLGAGATLDVVDVLPVQLRNLRSKLSPHAPVTLLHQDASALSAGDAVYDQALLFFLLHEQPDAVRRRTLAEALRVVRPGGKIVVVDYHRPQPWNLLARVFRPVLSRLEPYALDLWRHEVEEWLPHKVREIRKETSFGGLYQRLVIVR